MIIITLVLFFEATFASESYDIILDREVEILALHARQFCFENYLVLVFINVHTGIPSSSSNAFVIVGSREIGGKKAIDLVL
jgi:hypothetical protein